MSKIENAKTDRVLRDDELDLVSGGSDRPMEQVGDLKGASEQISLNADADYGHSIALFGSDYADSIFG